MNEKFKSRRWTDIPMPEVVEEEQDEITEKELEKIREQVFDELKEKGLDLRKKGFKVSIENR